MLFPCFALIPKTGGISGFCGVWYLRKCSGKTGPEMTARKSNSRSRRTNSYGRSALAIISAKALSRQQSDQIQLILSV